MNREQARRLFLEGGAHPHCPECHANRLQLLGQARPDHDIWNIYRCPACKTNFKATISMDEPVDVTA